MELVVPFRVLDIVDVDETMVVESHRVALLRLVQLVHVCRRRGRDESLRDRVIVVLQVTWYTSKNKCR